MLRIRPAGAGPRLVALLALTTALVAACSGGRHPAASSGTSTAPGSSAGPGTSIARALLPESGAGAGHLAPGSRPGILPGPVLVADEGNDRLVLVDPQGRVAWTFPGPGDLPAGVAFKKPDDAFFTPDGRQIIATEEEYSVVTLIDIATRRIVWRYGTPGRAGSALEHLSNPDDALVLPGGDVLTADIKNCRLLLLDRTRTAPVRVFGTTGVCRHGPPGHYGSPNGAFPMTNGHYLVTEINGDWVDEIDLTGRVYASFHPPGVSYPSDSNEVRPGLYLTVDYSLPGRIETFDAAGRVHWSYGPTGRDALNHPSLALPLPGGDVIATDDRNDRVIVVDPATGSIVWQYGIRGEPGAGPGLLAEPDGLDLAPPYSDLMVHAATMGSP